MKIYVNANAGRNGNGTAEMPFRRINDAAKIAKPGDEVLVYPGIYREYVNPVNAGTEDARITYRSVEPLGAVITGALLGFFTLVVTSTACITKCAAYDCE